MALHVKRKETPINLILLAAFTVVEVCALCRAVQCSAVQAPRLLLVLLQAYTVGVLVTFFDQAVVVQVLYTEVQDHLAPTEPGKL